MKLKVLTKNLQKSVSTVMRAVPPKNGISVTECIILCADRGVLFVSANNSEAGMRVSTDAKVEKAGALGVDATRFLAAIKSMDDEYITLTYDKDLLYVRAGAVNLTLTTIPAKVYPPFPELAYEAVAQIDGESFFKIISEVDYAVSADQTAVPFCGVCLDISRGKMTAVATNRQILSCRETAASGKIDRQFILPAWRIRDIAASISNEKAITISDAKNKLIVKTDNMEAYISTIAGGYAQYRDLIERCRQKTTARVKIAPLVNSINRAIIISDRKDFRDMVAVTLKFTVDKITVGAKTTLGEVVDAVECDTMADGIEIKFNAGLLLKTLKNIPDNECVLSIKDTVTPVLFTPVKGDDFAAIAAGLMK